MKVGIPSEVKNNEFRVAITPAGVYEFRRAGDQRLQAALQVRLADTLDRLGDPAAARLHRSAADRLLGDDPAACEIRSGSD